MNKYAHPALMFRIITNDSGIDNRKKYIKSLLKSIRYGDTESEIGKIQAQNAKYAQTEQKGKTLHQLGFSLPK